MCRLGYGGSSVQTTMVVVVCRLGYGGSSCLLEHLVKPTRLMQSLTMLGVMVLIFHLRSALNRLGSGSSREREREGEVK